jgi:hypothetical protein
MKRIKDLARSIVEFDLTPSGISALPAAGWIMVLIFHLNLRSCREIPKDSLVDQ